MRRRGFFVTVSSAVAARFAASEAAATVTAVVVKSAASAVHQPQCQAATASDGLNNFRIIRHHDISTKTSYLVCSNTSLRQEQGEYHGKSCVRQRTP